MAILLVLAGGIDSFEYGAGKVFNLFVVSLFHKLKLCSLITVYHRIARSEIILA
jgi:hypothetical protein